MTKLSPLAYCAPAPAQSTRPPLNSLASSPLCFSWTPISRARYCSRSGSVPSEWPHQKVTSRQVSTRQALPSPGTTQLDHRHTFSLRSAHPMPLSHESGRQMETNVQELCRHSKHVSFHVLHPTPILTWQAARGPSLRDTSPISISSSLRTLFALPMILYRAPWWGSKLPIYRGGYQENRVADDRTGRHSFPISLHKRQGGLCPFALFG